MRRYTTPTLTLTVKNQLISAADVYVTVEYNGGKLTFHDPDMSESNGDTVITLPFSQADTAKFKNGEILAIQVNWLSNSSRFATDIAHVTVSDNLLTEVLE